MNNLEIIKSLLEADGIGVLPTDTLYGLVGSAFSKKAVARIYTLKNRDYDKPFIILISSLNDLKKFKIKLTDDQVRYINTVWPDKISLILPCAETRFTYLHRQKKSLAFRLIGKKNRNLYRLIEEVGPLVAPSANPQDKPPALTIWEAKAYFKDKVDFYFCGGTRKSKPSTIISLLGAKPKILR
jgi:L-threonylcarbamoyladenylate synthase